MQTTLTLCIFSVVSIFLPFPHSQTGTLALELNWLKFVLQSEDENP